MKYLMCENTLRFLSLSICISSRRRELDTNFFFSNFSGALGISRDIPPKKFDFPGSEGHAELFGPPPLQEEDPHPAQRYPDQKVCVWVRFSSLSLGAECPQMWVWPQVRFGPSPLLHWRTKPQPFPSCNAPGGGIAGWCGGGVLGRRWVEGESRPSGTWGQTHIWAYSSGG